MDSISPLDWAIATNSTIPPDWIRAGDGPGSRIKAVAILFLILTWISVGLRCYVRVCITKLFRLDDWLAVATLFVFTLYCTFVLLGEKYGTGRHWFELAPKDFQLSMMWWYCGEITYVITTCLLKVTIGVFLMQICVKKIQINIIRTVIIGFSVFTLFFLFLMIFQCHPVSFFWTQSPDPNIFRPIGPGCIDRGVIADSTFAHGALSAAADWTLGILPIFLVWNLNMNPRTKISVALILALGAVGSTATIIRIPFISEIGQGEDFLFHNTDVSIWSTVEPGMGITASSMACLRPLFQAFFSRSRLLGSSNPGQQGASVWNPQRVGYVRDRNSEGFRLQGNLPKTFRGNPGAEADLEAGARARDDSTYELHDGNGWDLAKRSMTDDSVDEIRRFHTAGGVSVEHAEM